MTTINLGALTPGLTTTPEANLPADLTGSTTIDWTGPGDDGSGDYYAIGFTLSAQTTLLISGIDSPIYTYPGISGVGETGDTLTLAAGSYVIAINPSEPHSFVFENESVSGSASFSYSAKDIENASGQPITTATIGSTVYPHILIQNSGKVSGTPGPMQIQVSTDPNFGTFITVSGYSVGAVAAGATADDPLSFQIGTNLAPGLWYIRFVDGSATTASMPLTIQPSAGTGPLVTITTQGGVVHQAMQTIEGRVTAGSAPVVGTIVKIYDGPAPLKVFLAEATVQPDGSWSAPVQLMPSTSQIYAEDTDSANQTSSPSNYVLFTYPNPPTVTITPPVETLTNQDHPTISGTVTAGTAAVGSTVTLTDNGVVIPTGVEVQANGTWSTPVVLNEGENSFVASNTDASGETGSSSPVIYDLASQRPTVSLSGADDGNNTFELSVTTSAEQVDNKAGEPVVSNEIVSVEIYNGATDLGPATQNFGGVWIYTINDAVAGDYSFTAVVTDSLGNQTTTTAPVHVDSGADQSVDFEDPSGDQAYLNNSAGTWDMVNGNGGSVYLSEAYAEVTGGGNSINFESAPADAAALYNTGTAWDNVNASGGFVVLASAFANINGGGDNVYLEGTGNAASLTNTGGVFDSIHATQGLIEMTNAYAAITGGSNAVYFDNNSGNVAALFGTGGLWDGVYGSNGVVVLQGAYAEVAGGGNSIYFEGVGDAASLYNTNGVYDSIQATQGLIELTSAYAAVTGGSNAIYFENNSGNAAALFNTGGLLDGVWGSGGLVVLSNANALLTGSKNSIYMYGSSEATQNGGSESFAFQAKIGGLDEIQGFVAGDTLQFSASDFANWSAFQQNVSQSNADTVITLDSADKVTLTNVIATSLVSTEFRFV